MDGMTLSFAKYQGTGNDFILIDGLKGLPDVDWAAFARRWCDRHYGIGADGVILVLEGQAAPFAMRVINADGSGPEMCGNGLRCFVKYLADRGLSPAGRFAVETGAGVLHPEVLADGRVKVDMGRPILARTRIPMSGPEAERVVDEPLAVGDETFLVTAVSMGNPHAVIFVADAQAVPLETWGPAIERHDAFPARTNVEFAQVLNPHEARMRVWERGAGPTLACGTGACATLVAGVLTGRLARQATIHLPGGPLEIAWGADDHILMTGAAEAVFTGELSA
jgi:diaminopimelate epimerase